MIFSGKWPDWNFFNIVLLSNQAPIRKAVMKKLLLPLIIILMGIQVSAQVLQPAKWTYQVTKNR